MPTNADVLNFATQKLIPKWTEQFYQHHPILDKVLLKGNIEKGTQGGPYLEFPVVTNGPGKVTRIETGSEVYSSTRRTVGTRGQIYCPRMVYSFIIPGKDLAEASGETAIARLIKVYPEAALMEFHEYIVSQIVNGNGSTNNVEGMLTLNGDTTFNPQGTAVNGIMDFAAPGSQTDVVLGITKSSTTGWYNQYQTVSSFATDGRKQMRRVYWDGSMQGKQGGPVDLMIGDIASYNNYYDDLDDQVRYATSFKGETGKAVRQGLMFQDAEFYVEPDLDTTLSQFSTSAVSSKGCVYFLKSDSWHIYTQGEDTGMETKGDFAFRGPVKVPGQDAWEWEIVLSMQLYCDRLNANGVVAGTAVS